MLFVLSRKRNVAARILIQPSPFSDCALIGGFHVIPQQMLGYGARNTIHLRTPCHASIPYFQRRIEKILLLISLNTRRATFSVIAATILFHPGDFMHDLHNLISGRGLVALEIPFNRCIRRTIDLRLIFALSR